MTGDNNKRQITAVFYGSLVGDFLPVQLVYNGKMPRSHPWFEFPPGGHITHSPKHCMHRSTEKTMVQHVEHIIVPYVEQTRETVGDDKPAVVIIDNFKGHTTDTVTDLLDTNNIHTMASVYLYCSDVNIGLYTHLGHRRKPAFIRIYTIITPRYTMASVYLL